jgi:hypothetical protein
MKLTDLQLYLTLKEKFGEDDAQTLVEYIVAKINEAAEAKSENLKTSRQKEELNLHAKKAASNLRKWERVATVTIIVVYLLVVGLYFKK